MCGRFTLSYKANELQLAFDLKEVPEEWQPRYNLAPTQPIAAVLDAEKRKLEFLYWGLVPSWAKDVSIGSKMINARAETVAEKPSFRAAFQRRRCLILADGFYEWKKFQQKNVASQPYYIKRKDSAPFAFAGLWEIWQSPDGGELWSGTIITCPANEMIQSIHPRMPVILDKTNMWQWLQAENPGKAQQMLVPYDPDQMEMYPVSRGVNNPQKDSPECIEPRTDSASPWF